MDSSVEIFYPTNSASEKNQPLGVKHYQETFKHLDDDFNYHIKESISGLVNKCSDHYISFVKNKSNKNKSPSLTFDVSSFSLLVDRLITLMTNKIKSQIQYCHFVTLDSTSFVSISKILSSIFDVLPKNIQEGITKPFTFGKIVNNIWKDFVETTQQGNASFNNSTVPHLCFILKEDCNIYDEYLLRNFVLSLQEYFNVISFGFILFVTPSYNHWIFSNITLPNDNICNVLVAINDFGFLFEKIMFNVLLTSHTPAMLSPDVICFILHCYLERNFPFSSIISMIKYIILSNQYMSSKSSTSDSPSFVCEKDSTNDKLISISSLPKTLRKWFPSKSFINLDVVLNLKSFRRYVEKLSDKSVKKSLLTDNDFLKKTIVSLLEELVEYKTAYRHTFLFFLQIIRNLKDKHSTPCSMLKFNELLTNDQTPMTLQMKWMSLIEDSSPQNLISIMTTSSQQYSKITESDISKQSVICLKEYSKIVELIKEKSTQMTTGELQYVLAERLAIFLQKNLIHPSKVLFNELFLFDDLDSFITRFDPTVRHEFHQTMMSEFYDTKKSSSRNHDTCVLYQLLLDESRDVNLAFLSEKFQRNILDSKKRRRSSIKIEPVTQRFIQAVKDLEIMGFIEWNCKNVMAKRTTWIL